MTKKDFLRIGSALHYEFSLPNNSEDRLTGIRGCADRIADIFSQDNVRFNRARFLRLVETGKDVRSLPVTVYVAAAWWPDCEPFVGVIAKSHALAERIIMRAMREENHRAHDVPKDEDFDEEPVWSGVFQEALADLPALTEEQETDLRAQGYCWQDTP